MDNFIGFVNDLEVNNNRLIITMQDINNMLPDLKDLLDMVIKTWFNYNDKHISCAIIEKDAKLHNNRSPRLLDVGGVDKYYNKYRCTTVGRLF
jgi:hypothetical protein